MGKRGRPPKPTKLKILTGNPGKRPLNDHEPKPASVAPTCPHWLDTEAKKKWKALIPELERMGLATAVDGDTLACYCQAWAEFRVATETLKKDGRTTFGGTGGMKPHPCIAMQRSAWKAIKEFASLFGLDPSSRSRLSIPGTQEEKDELEDFLANAQ